MDGGETLLPLVALGQAACHTTREGGAMTAPPIKISAEEGDDDDGDIQSGKGFLGG